MLLFLLLPLFVIYLMMKQFSSEFHLKFEYIQLNHNKQVCFHYNKLSLSCKLTFHPLFSARPYHKYGQYTLVLKIIYKQSVKCTYFHNIWMPSALPRCSITHKQWSCIWICLNIVNGLKWSSEETQRTVSGIWSLIENWSSLWSRLRKQFTERNMFIMFIKLLNCMNMYGYLVYPIS